MENQVKFYFVSQNNSGGRFIVNETLSRRIYIEAYSKEDAIEKAENLGCYWNGVSEGIDCPCCGDRWDTPGEMPSFPLVYDDNLIFNTIEEYVQYHADKYGWTSPEARIFYLNGEVKEIFKKKLN